LEERGVGCVEVAVAGFCFGGRPGPLLALGLAGGGDEPAAATAEGGAGDTARAGGAADLGEGGGMGTAEESW